jgi:hypothetical protein
MITGVALRASVCQDPSVLIFRKYCLRNDRGLHFQSSWGKLQTITRCAGMDWLYFWGRLVPIKKKNFDCGWWHNFTGCLGAILTRAWVCSADSGFESEHWKKHFKRIPGWIQLSLDILMPGNGLGFEFCRQIPVWADRDSLFLLFSLSSRSEVGGSCPSCHLIGVADDYLIAVWSPRTFGQIDVNNWTQSANQKLSDSYNRHLWVTCGAPTPLRRCL